MNHFFSWKFRSCLVLSAILFCSLSPAFAQKTEKHTFEFPDRTVAILVPVSITVEKTEESTFRLVYKVESYVDPESYADRLFVEVTNTYLTPQKGNTVVLDMSPFEKPATLHAWNPDDRAAYVSFDESNPTVDLNNIDYKGGQEGAEGKFSGEVKAIGFSTPLNTDIGDHVVEIRKFALE